MKFKGESEAYRIEECCLELVYSLTDEDEEYIYYMATGISTGYMIEFADSVDIVAETSSPHESNEEDSEDHIEIDDKSELFEQYMKYVELHRFISSSGVEDDHYKKKAESILELLKKEN